MDWNPASHRYLLFLDKHNLGKAWRQGKSPGRVHGYYEKGLFVGSTRREDFNWNVNCVRMSVSSGRNTTVRLATNTPNLDHLEMQRDGNRWQRCGSTVNLRIPSAGLCLSARSVKRFGLAGPASNIVLCAAVSGPTQ